MSKVDEVSFEKHFTRDDAYIARKTDNGLTNVFRFSIGKYPNCCGIYCFYNFGGIPSLHTFPVKEIFDLLRQAANQSFVYGYSGRVGRIIAALSDSTQQILIRYFLDHGAKYGWNLLLEFPNFEIHPGHTIYMFHYDPLTDGVQE